MRIHRITVESGGFIEYRITDPGAEKPYKKHLVDADNPADVHNLIEHFRKELGKDIFNRRTARVAGGQR